MNILILILTKCHRAGLWRGKVIFDDRSYLLFFIWKHYFLRWLIIRDWLLYFSKGLSTGLVHHSWKRLPLRFSSMRSLTTWTEIWKLNTIYSRVSPVKRMITAEFLTRSWWLTLSLEILVLTIELSYTVPQHNHFLCRTIHIPPLSFHISDTFLSSNLEVINCVK